MGAAEERLAEIGIVVPEPPPPAGSYVPVAVHGGMAYVSGQIPVDADGLAYAGRVDVSNSERAAEAARLCAVNVLAQLRAELGSLDRVARIVRVAGFVNSKPGFMGHSDVVDEASELFVRAFGEAGRHSRIAVGASGLPLGAMVEIEAIAAVRP